MRIVFMGTPDFAVPSLQAIHQSPNHQIVSVVTTPDKRAGRGLKLRQSAVKTAALERGYPVVQPESLKSEEFLNIMRDCHANLFVVVAFRILPEKLFSIPPLGAVNLHASLLPRYRGAAPIHRAIMNGETRTGITTFSISRKVDTGGILLQEEVPIPRNATTGELWEVLSQKGADLLVRTLDGLESGSLHPKAQDHTLATPAPKISRDEGRIRWDQPAVKIHNLIRAFTPFPGAYTRFRRKNVKLSGSSVMPGQGKPGVIIPENGRLFVGTGDGIISIGHVQVEGKKRIPAEDFIRGYQLTGDDRFE